MESEAIAWDNPASILIEMARLPCTRTHTHKPIHSQQANTGKSSQNTLWGSTPILLKRILVIVGTISYSLYVSSLPDHLGQNKHGGIQQKT